MRCAGRWTARWSCRMRRSMPTWPTYLAAWCPSWKAARGRCPPMTGQPCSSCSPRPIRRARLRWPSWTSRRRRGSLPTAAWPPPSGRVIPLLVAAGAFRLVIVFLGARYYAQAAEVLAHCRRCAVARRRWRHAGSQVDVGRADPATGDYRRAPRRRPERRMRFLDRARPVAGGSGRGATTTARSSARLTWRCTRSRWRSSWATRAGRCGPPRTWMPPGCRRSGGRGCSSTSRGRTRSAARSTTPWLRWSRRRSIDSRAGARSCPGPPGRRRPAGHAGPAGAGASRTFCTGGRTVISVPGTCSI